MVKPEERAAAVHQMILEALAADTPHALLGVLVHELRNIVLPMAVHAKEHLTGESQRLILNGTMRLRMLADTLDEAARTWPVEDEEG